CLLLTSHTTVTSTLSLHDALPIWGVGVEVLEDAGVVFGGFFADGDRSGQQFFEVFGEGLFGGGVGGGDEVAGVLFGDVGVGEVLDRKSTRLNSSHVKISYAVFCLK